MTNSLRDLLDKEGIWYKVIECSPVINANAAAFVAGIPEHQMLKTIVMNSDDMKIMAVLPATALVDFNMFKGATHSHRVSKATEDELQEIFPKCEVGAMPPLGNLLGIKMVVDECVTQSDFVCFRSGVHGKLIKMKTEDFFRIAQPQFGKFTVPKAPIYTDIGVY